MRLKIQGKIAELARNFRGKPERVIHETVRGPPHIKCSLPQFLPWECTPCIRKVHHKNVNICVAPFFVILNLHKSRIV